MLEEFNTMFFHYPLWAACAASLLSLAGYIGALLAVNNQSVRSGIFAFFFFLLVVLPFGNGFLRFMFGDKAETETVSSVIKTADGKYAVELFGICPHGYPKKRRVIVDEQTVADLKDGDFFREGGK